jgi:regulator of protease activity HflC (stomatin/prohibitin superfamily)
VVFVASEVFFGAGTLALEVVMHRWLWLAGAALLIGTGCTYMTVDSGQVGILWTTHGVENQVYREGQYAVGFFDRPTVYDTRSQEREEQLQVLAANGLQIELDTSIRYHIIPDEVVKLDQELGIHYYSILLGPTLRSQARRVVGRFQPEEIYSTQRDTIEREVREGIGKVIQGRHIELEAVLIRNVTLPGVIQQAINDKLEAEQQSLKMKFVIEKAKQEADQHLIETKAQVEREALEAQAANEREQARAKAEAQETVVRAQAAADAKRIDGKATAEYQQAVQAHLTEPVLKLERIKALDALARSPNAKVLLSGEDKSLPVVELK